MHASASTPPPPTAQPQAQADPQASVPDDVQAPRPAGPVTARSADPGERWLVAAIAVGVILAAILVGLLVRRNRRPTEGTVVSLARPLWVAGVSADPTVGPFAGSAAALHVSPPSGSDDEPAIRYCVIDEQRGTPVWVSPQDIRESRDLDERQRRQAASALAGHPAAARGGRFARPASRSRRAAALTRRRTRGRRTCSAASPGFARWGCPPKRSPTCSATNRSPHPQATTPGPPPPCTRSTANPTTTTASDRGRRPHPQHRARRHAGARNLSGRAQPPGEPPGAGRPSGDTTAGATAPTPPG